jgi:hypothetical protein
MRITDLKAAISPVIVALMVASGLVPTAMRLSLASHQGAAVTVVAPSHHLAEGVGPNNNPWD